MTGRAFLIEAVEAYTRKEKLTRVEIKSDTGSDVHHSPPPLQQEQQLNVLTAILAFQIENNDRERKLPGGQRLLDGEEGALTMNSVDVT